jgi:hypothetical protein
MQKVKRDNASKQSFRNALLPVLPATLRGPPHTLVTSHPIATVGGWADTTMVMEKARSAYKRRAMLLVVVGNSQ